MTLPSPEARIAAQEALTTMLHARIEQLAQDMSSSFKHLSHDMDASFKANAQYQVEQEQKIEARFDTIEATLSEHSKRFDKLEAILLQIFDRLPQPEGE